MRRIALIFASLRPCCGWGNARQAADQLNSQQWRTSALVLPAYEAILHRWLSRIQGSQFAYSFLAQEVASRQPQTVAEYSLPSEKLCNTCLQVKPASEYTKHPHSRDKLRHRCKQCHAENSGKHFSQPRVAGQRCSTCRLWKSASDFNRSQASSTGLQYNCRSCAVIVGKGCHERLAELNKAHAGPKVKEKQCSKCKEKKPAADFGKSIITSSGLLPRCKACDSLDRAARYARLILPAIAAAKLCRSCGQEKPSTEFYKGKHTKEGLMTYCIPCTATISKRKRDAAKAQASKAQASKQS